MINLLYDLCPQMLFYSLLYTGLWSIIAHEDAYSLVGVLFIVVFTLVCTSFKHFIERYIFSVGAIILFTVLSFLYGVYVLKDPAYCAITILIGIFTIISKLITSFEFMSTPDNIVLGLHIAIYIISQFFKCDQLGRVMFYITCLYLIVFIVYKNHTNIREYIEARRLTTIMSEKKMKTYFCTFISILAISIVAVICVSKTVDYTPVYDKIASIFKYEKLSAVPKQQDMSEDMTSSIDALNEETDSEPSVVLQVAFKVLKVFVIILTVAAVLIIILFLVKSIFQLICNSTKKAPTKKEFLFASVEVRETIEKDKTKRKVKETLEKNPNNKIRKLYKKNMNGFRKHVVQDEYTYTPKEQREILNQQGHLVEEEVVALYEHARYSNIELQKEDVKRMEQLLNKRSK